MENIEDLANALGIKKFFLAAVSGGGPYALAAAAQIPGRLRGILLLSAAGSPGKFHAHWNLADPNTSRRLSLHSILKWSGIHA